MMAAMKLLLIFLVGVSLSSTNGEDVPGLDFIPRPNPNYHRDAFVWVASKEKKNEGLLSTLLAAEKGISPTTSGPNVVDCDVHKRSRTASDATVCRFDTKSLGPCTSRNHFGFTRAEPCVLLSLDKLVGWKPKDNTGVIVECRGKNPPDKDNIGPVAYYPASRRMESFYYPFYNQDNYMSPLVAVKFKHLVPGVIVFVECTASDSAGEVGRTNFEIVAD